ncbi:MAG: ABC transporter ATP-binding protein [Armatimonadetes bacterium]|nr:ABC transporter ATP-binding protein [Armatimonadota bacterium]
MALLSVRGLRVAFRSTVVVDGLDLDVSESRTTALVGESGCGKSISALAVMGLVPWPGEIIGGEIDFEGRALSQLTADERRRLRGRRIGLISQDPLAALNPVHTVGAQVAEAHLAHGRMSRREAWSLAVEALAEVGIPTPAQRAHDYPHQLSGGQRQRVVIAMAIACRPALLIADEPTTALDVSVQAQILDLLRRLQAEHAMGLLLITHDLGVVAEMADRVTVMRGGRVMEEADVRQLYAAPQHAYTRALLAAVPRLDRRRERLATVETSDA